MRKALIVGIDHYDFIGNLFGCVNDAYKIHKLISTNDDGSVNFPQPRILIGIENGPPIDRVNLKDSVRTLFIDDSDVALLYFAGHGHIEDTGGYICSSDCKSGDDGLSLSEIMKFANKSPARSKIIILDSCFGGALGDSHIDNGISEIREGVTILTASTKEQYAAESDGGGVFTELLADALRGAAANLVGDVTPGSIYAHIDQSLGPWSQRPVFKTNVKQFISLRKAKPPLELQELRKISELFPTSGHQYKLDPSFEPERSQHAQPTNLPPPDPEKNAIFAILQKYNRVGLVVPEGAPHMWHAAIESKTVRLTALGEHYRRLASEKLI